MVCAWAAISHGFVVSPHAALAPRFRGAPLEVRMDGTWGQHRAPEFAFPEQPTHSVAVYETMVKVKPYPIDCPFDDSDFESGADLELEPVPSPAETAALQKLYSRWLPGSRSVLEVVCDGRSRVRTRRSVTQLHLTPHSYRTGRRYSPKLDHRTITPGFCAAGADLPWEAGKFDLVRSRPARPGASCARRVVPELLACPTSALRGPRHHAARPERQRPAPAACPHPPPRVLSPWQIVCHGCIPYVAEPLHLLGELSRVLAPSGTPAGLKMASTLFDDSAPIGPPGASRGSARAYGPRSATWAAWKPAVASVGPPSPLRR